MHFLSLCFLQGNLYSLLRNTERGFLFVFDCRVAKLVGRDDPIAPPTRNENKPGSPSVIIKARARSMKMKRLNSTVALMFAALVVCASLCSNAETEVVDGIEWAFDTKRRDIDQTNYYYYACNAYIIDKSAIPENVVVPNTLGGCRVETIATRAFEGCTNIVSLTMPNSINGFGYQAFGGCSKLTAVNVESIEQWCGIGFSDCEYGKSHYNLGSNPLNNGAGLYTNGVLITDFVLPTNVFSIARDAFYGCGSLKSVTLHDKIGTIEEGVFAYCANLESVVMSNGVRFVEGGMYYPGAFEYCSCLTNLVLSTNLTYIGEHSFMGCGLKDIILPDSLATICTDCFSGCRSLTNVVFGTGLKNISHGVFSQCGLTHIELPESIASIPAYMFDGCRALKSVKLPKSVAFIGMSAFRDCNSISEVHIDDLESWCKIDFTWSDESNNPGNPFTANPLVFGSELYVAGEPVRGALHIPNAVGNIAPYAFYGWTNVSSVIFADGVARIEHEAFAESGVQSVRFGSGIETMGYGAFEGCANLSEIDFGRMSANIDESVFLYCENLGDVIIPGRIDKIGDYAFGGCGLTNVTICSGVKDVGSAFSGCGKLERISIPDSVTNLSAWAFSMCEGLKDVALGYGLSKIPEGAFADCYNLTNITMSAGITKIGGYSFSNCGMLKNLTMLEGVTDIESGAFEWCSSLEDMRIPNSVETIGSGAFIGCIGLKSIEVGSAVAEIGDWAFANLENLETIIFRGNAPSAIGEDVFEYINPDCVVRVPRNSTDWGVEVPGMWYGMRIEYIIANVGIAEGKGKIMESGGEYVVTAKEDAVLTKEDFTFGAIAKEAYEITIAADGKLAVVKLAAPQIGMAAEGPTTKDDDDPTGMLVTVDESEISAKPIPEAGETLGALPVKTYPGLYYQVGWGDDLVALTLGEKVQANGDRLYLGVIKQRGNKGFYKLTVSEE